MKRVEFDVTLSPDQLKERAQRIEVMLKNEGVKSFLKNHGLDETMVHNHVQKFETWQDNLAKCKDCPGLHACKQDTQGYVLELHYDELLSWQLKPCAYQIIQLEQTAHQMYFVQLDTGQPFLQAQMSTIFDEAADASYMKAIKDIPSWLNQAQMGWYFYGSLGSGKTHLAMAILNHFAKLKQKVAFVSVPELAHQYFSSYQQDESSERKLAQIKRASVVVFDDMGAETYSPYFRDEVLFNLLNHRMEHKLLTLFTSNHQIESLQQHYRISSKGDDEPIKSARLMQRIQALSKPLHITGRNRRF